MKTFDEQKRYERAKERVTELKKFYNNIISYILVIGCLAGLNYYQNEWDYKWFIWPAFGWGIGVVFHAIKAYQLNPIYNKDWEERKIKKYMQEEEENSNQLWE